MKNINNKQEAQKTFGRLVKGSIDKVMKDTNNIKVVSIESINYNTGTANVKEVLSSRSISNVRFAKGAFNINTNDKALMVSNDGTLKNQNFIIGIFGSNIPQDRLMGRTIHSFSANATVNETVTFNREFLSVPYVFATANETDTASGNYNAQVYSITTTGCIIRLRETDATNRTADVPCAWIAYGQFK